MAETKKPAAQVVRLTEGLGYGKGTISHEARRGEVVGDETLTRVEALIGNSAEILVAVSKDKDGVMVDDDGCGDGRAWGRIFQGIRQRFKSLHRPKVFGGGATMAAAGLIGLGKAKGKTLRQVFSGGISVLRDHQIDFGAHTDSKAHGANCGCGAIDKAPEIIQNVVAFEDSIRASIATLGVDSSGLDEVFSQYGAYAAAIEDQPYTGADVMKEIADNGKIIKELSDDHFEMYIILNKVAGYTVNQEKVREASNGQVHVFAVDEWRVRQLAERMYPADESTPDTQHKVYLSELVYTLATAATLTKGDLPVYVIDEVRISQLEPAVA